MMFHALYDTKEAFVVWDRCRYSNLIFYYIHYLMGVYEKEPMPGPDDEKPILYINNLALGTGLFKTLPYMEDICADPIPVSYTHLDVYKRQLLSTTPTTSEIS